MQEEINALLEKKKIADPFIKYQADLSEAFEAKNAGGIFNKLFGSKSRPLPRDSAELGLLLINRHPEYKDQETAYSNIVVAAFNGKRYNRIKKLVEDDWNSEGNYQLLILFFGEEKADHVRHAWQQMRYQMYQGGYSRRSFRSPEDREMYFQRQIAFIIHLLRQSFVQVYENGYKFVYYDLTLVEQIRYSHATNDSNPELFRLWSSAVDRGNKEVFQQLEDIVYNKDSHGKLTRSVIKALLNSGNKEGWVIVEKLLLAAQRQEGLRQTILEALDETSIGALKYMIRVVIEHDLARFSSVVRAIDVWAGLGWESEKEATVRSFLQKASLYLENIDAIPEAIRSDNNADVYMALWAQGVYDVEKTLPYLQELYRKGDTQKRTLAILFGYQTLHYKIDMPICAGALEDPDLPPLGLAVGYIKWMAGIGNNAAVYNKHRPKLFDQLHSVYKRIQVKERTFEGYVFSWYKIQFERKEILQAMLTLVGEMPERLEVLVGYMEDMDAEVKRQLSWAILPMFKGYGPLKKLEQPLTAFQRKFAFELLNDRSEFEIGFKALENDRFSPEELAAFPEWLKRKAAGFRRNIITILLRQDQQKLAPVVEELLKGDPEQRAAGLDIILQLKKEGSSLSQTGEWLEAFRQRKITPKEEILLAQLTDTGEGPDVSAANGFGMFDPAKCAPVIRPAVDMESWYEQCLARHPFGLSMPMNRIKEAMLDLGSLLEQYKHYEYEVENWDGKEKVLLGNVFRKLKYQQVYTTPEEHWQDYPLPEVWRSWYIKWAFEPRDIALLDLACYSDAKAVSAQLPDKKDFIPEKYIRQHYGSPMLGVLAAVNALFPMERSDEFFLGAAVRLFASLSEAELKDKPSEPHYSSYGDGWQQKHSLHLFTEQVDPGGMDEKLVPLYWNLYNWRQYSGREENIVFSMPPLMIFCRAFEKGVINEHDMLRGLLHRQSIQALSQTTKHAHDIDFFGRFPFLRGMFSSVSDYILDIELKRGDTPTSVSRLTSGLSVLYGVERFTQILAGMGKTTLRKGYYYNGSTGQDKQESFSHLLKACHPLAGDSQEQFDASMKLIKVTDQRLIEAAVYAPQWQRFVSSYLGWKGLDNAIWWMHAHTKTDGYRAINAEAESEIARYSSLDVEEFKEGAVDKEWFWSAYKEIGEERWGKVYDAAKYITDGNGHRRARIYADVLVGNLSLKEVTEKIDSKRDQDYVRIYGLAPLSKADPQKDILGRYAFIQQFKKGSRQFGAQKQTSEAAAVKIAMDNLARNAGYPDPMRLTWAMETTQAQAIFSKETQVQFDDVVIGLIIDEEGEADVVAFKGEQQLKAIPAKYKKDVKVEELNGFKKMLREQFRRSRKGLEEVMVRGDVFLITEIKDLFAHPVIARHLEKLVFILDNREGQGFYKDGNLVDGNGEVIALTASDALRIAHCTDLHKTESWAGFQRLAFDQGLQQPFKQIFRELYLPTPDELQEGSISRRYAGHQIQPKQTVALLRTRGWKVNYEEGLQKVFHKEGFAAQMYAMADWFSPAEVESPTLETVVFTDLKTFKNVAFSSIHPRTFSEVMRDVDLVVSVAHAGGVDPEASHSSIEMRAALLRETIRLFKLDNVAIEGSHAVIKGSMGEYTVHLGSAVVHRMLSGYLSILPVQSQHRGRIFLPFVDDDPRSAELLSKVLLLARDKEIKDPMILQQLN